jgi:protein NrfD
LEGVGLALLLAFGLDGQPTRAAVTELVSGEFALVFWVGVVGCGLVAPLGIDGISLRGNVSGRGMRMTVRRGYAFAPVALLLLVGGYCLRVALLGAGLPLFIATATMTLGAGTL